MDTFEYDDVFTEGYEAFHEGVLLLENPYPITSEYCSTWNIGWRQAQRDRQNSQRKQGV
jgi:ribosome modulation factor